MLAADLYALLQNFWLTSCRRALVPSKQKTFNLPLPKKIREFWAYIPYFLMYLLNTNNQTKKLLRHKKSLYLLI